MVDSFYCKKCQIRSQTECCCHISFEVLQSSPFSLDTIQNVLCELVRKGLFSILQTLFPQMQAYCYSVAIPLRNVQIRSILLFHQFRPLLHNANSMGSNWSHFLLILNVRREFHSDKFSK